MLWQSLSGVLLLIDTISAATLLASLPLGLRLNLGKVHSCHGYQKDPYEGTERQSAYMPDLHKGIDPISRQQDDIIVAVPIKVYNLQRNSWRRLQRQSHCGLSCVVSTQCLCQSELHADSYKRWCSRQAKLLAR